MSKKQPPQELATTADGIAWHSLGAAQALQQLHSNHEGLSEEEAQRRLRVHGPNEWQTAVGVSAGKLLLAQFANVLILLLLAATAASAWLGHGTEAIAIAVIVLFAVLLGFFQEYRAEKAMEALRSMAAPTATALRDGRETTLPARLLVPGDVILLRAGDKVPADCRLMDAVNLQADEAALTGESVAVAKNAACLAPRDTPLGDRLNLAFGGTAITQGRGRGAVVATGMDSEFGHIVRLLQGAESHKTPLQQNLDKVGRSLALAALAIVGLILGIGIWRGEPLIDMLIFSIALAVAVVPEALPAVVTISLSIGAQRMIRRNALIRHLPAVETLGGTSVICTDKTGTLTKNEMTVRRIVTGDAIWDVSGVGYTTSGNFLRDSKPCKPDAALELLLRAGVLASDADILFDETQNRWLLTGDPTEGALVVAAAKAALRKADLDERYPRVGEIPFSSESKRMTTLHRVAGGVVAYAKGAPEVILANCTRILGAAGETELDEAGRTALLQQAQTMAGRALRVLAVAQRDDASLKNAEQDMLFLGLFGMIDPPRPEARDAIKTCRRAGIRVAMITGDHPRTAQAVAEELGLLSLGGVVTGAELEAMDDERLRQEVESISVYARVSPAHKLRIVKALQRNGHITAMTGDGVNDAPALKQADIGIAMGIAGTDVSKEAAAMMLTDDNFASIVAAVEEGRAIFGNIKKYLMYLLSSNLGEIGLMANASLLGLPLPLSAVQLLYVNLATDGLPALALAVDPPEADLMRRAPRDPRRGIFTRPVVSLMITGGVWSALANLGLFMWALESGRGYAEAMSMTFTSLVLIQFFKAYNFRSDRHTLWRGLLRNRWLNLAVLWESALLWLIVEPPWLQGVFGTVALTLDDWLIVGGVALSVCPVLEAAKLFVRNGRLGRDA